MGLVKWDSVNDYFNHGQLAANFTALDAHDHTAGKGKQIPAGGIEDQAISASNLSDEVYTQLGENLAEESIISKTIHREAITTEKIANDAVTSGKAKITCGVVKATADVTLSETLKDITGVTLTLTPTVSSNLLVLTYMGLNMGESSQGFGVVTLDGTSQEGIEPYFGLFNPLDPPLEAAGSGAYLLSLSGASHTIKLRGRIFGSTGVAKASRTGFAYILFAA